MCWTCLWRHGGGVDNSATPVPTLKPTFPSPVPRAYLIVGQAQQRVAHGAYVLRSSLTQDHGLERMDVLQTNRIYHRQA